MKGKLRDYQLEHVRIHFRHRNQGGPSGVQVMPTGGGKTPVTAAIVEGELARGGRVVVLTHVQELVQQQAGTIASWLPGVDHGVVSAGLGRKEYGHRVTVAGIQSCWRHADQLGEATLAIIDEAHLVSDKEGSMYKSLLDHLPQAFALGLTATPFRTDSGALCHRDGIFKQVIHRTPVADLLEGGWIRPLITPESLPEAQIETQGLPLSGNDFALEPLQEACVKGNLVERACGEGLQLSAGRHRIIVFASGVAHARQIMKILQAANEECEIVTGSCPKVHRDSVINDFRRGDLRFIVNVNVLTTGFDVPEVDALWLMRPTMSPGLSMQQLGRLMRRCEGLKDGLVLDYAGNLKRHGPIDDPNYGLSKEHRKAGAREPGERPTRTCPKCKAKHPFNVKECSCGWEFPRKDVEASVSDRADRKSKVYDPEKYEPKWHDVSSRVATVHVAKSGAECVKIVYTIGYHDTFTQFLTPGHDRDFVRRKAADWWVSHHEELPMPNDAQVFVDCIDSNMCADTLSILVSPQKDNPRFSEFHAYKAGPMKPEEEWGEKGREHDDRLKIDEEDIPF